MVSFRGQKRSVSFRGLIQISDEHPLPRHRAENILVRLCCKSTHGCTIAFFRSQFHKLIICKLPSSFNRFVDFCDCWEVAFHK